MSFFDIVKTILPLVLILLFLFGILILIRKYSFSMNSKKIRMLNVHVLHNQLILPKKYLSLVRIQDKILVLGVSENSITLLKEIDYAQIEDDELNQQDTKQNFIDILKQNLGMR